MTDTVETLQSRANRLVEDHFNLMRALIAMREHHDLSQREVGERMGVTQATVAKLERAGANPTLATIRRYAMAVGAAIDTQVFDDCEHERAKRAPFEELVYGSGVNPSGWLATKRIRSTQIPARWTRSVDRTALKASSDA